MFSWYHGAIFFLFSVRVIIENAKKCDLEIMKKKYTNEIVTLEKHTHMTTDSKVPPPPLHTQKYSPEQTHTHTV